MANWYLLTIVGEDRPGIVARVTGALFEGGCNLGEASMIRLGGNFTIMLMVQLTQEATGLEAMLAPVAASMGLRLNVDPIEGHHHTHVVPDVRITVFGADRAGIVAQVTGILDRAGLNILDLKSDVAGGDRGSIYIMHIEGQALQGIEALEQALAAGDVDGLDVSIEPVEALVG
jgi:glycine cleavage system transcriptional repressor